MNPFVDRLLDDLRAFSPELLEPGANRPARFTTARRGHGSVSFLLQTAADVAQLVPRVLQDSRSDESRVSAEEMLTHVPVRAVPSRHAAHYALAHPATTATSLLPKVWLRRDPVIVADHAALRWVAYVLQRLEQQIESAHERTARYREEVLDTDGGTAPVDDVSRASESEALSSTCRRIEAALHQLTGSRAMLSQVTDAAVSPSRRPPVPFPQSPSWQVFKRKALPILDPTLALSAGVTSLLEGEVETADVPYLYQRWCGVQILDAFRRHGWNVRGDPLGPLYLGGSIEMQREGIRIDLWIETLLTPGLDNPSGYFCTRGRSARPDFLIVTPGPHGTDAFALDATKTADDTVLRGKFKYLDVIASQLSVRIAGVSTHLPPLRSWAAAPVAREQCDLRAPNGSVGVVPLHPLRSSRQALHEWVGDVAAHARQWSRRPTELEMQKSLLQER